MNLGNVAGAAEEMIKGPFQNTKRTTFTSASYFFIDNSAGTKFDVLVKCLTIGEKAHNIDITQDDRFNAFPRILVRVFDRDEYLIRREEITSPELAGDAKLASNARIEIPSSQRGIIQVAVISGPPATFDLITEPVLPFGMMNSIQVVTPPKNPIEKGYIYVPKGAKELRVEPIRCKTTLWDENDNVVFRDKGEPVIVRKTDVIWKISIQPETWPGSKIYVTGFPVIVCPDKKTAENIRGSYEQLDDGSIVAHKFQVRLDRLVRKRFKNLESFQLDPIKSYENMMPIFLSNPERYHQLIGGYSPILPHHNFWINRQVLDAGSPYFGGIHGVHQKLRYVIPGNLLNPTNVDEQISGLPPPATDDLAINGGTAYAGTAYSPWGILDIMRQVYNLDKEINPYYHNTNLLNRLIIAATRDLMLLKEDELVHNPFHVDWPGSLAFVFELAQTKVYGEVGRACKELYPEIYREWTEGMKRYADRLSYACSFPPANQGAHVIAGLWRVYKGTDDPYYRKLVEYNLERFCATLQKPAGYFVEGYGPCTSYNGITLALLANLYLESRLPWVQEAIRRNYYCYNHTVASEPSGRLVGVTDLNHRVHKPWTHPQYGAGKKMMKPYLQEAGIWFRQPISDREKSSLIESIEEYAPKTPYAFNYYVEDQKRTEVPIGSFCEYNYRHFNASIMAGGLFPFEEKGPYVRNLGDEFICVRQPKYYALIYVGKPGIGPKETVKPMEKWARTGGGISLLWTPEYYVTLAGQGWNSYCHHGLIADLGNDKVCSADYYSVNFTLDTEKKTLLVNGKVKNTPLKYRYFYTFKPDQIGIKMTVEAEKKFDCQSCYLQFPLFASKDREFIASIPEKGRTLRVSDNTGAGVNFNFENDMECRIGHTSESQIEDTFVFPSGLAYIIKQLKVMLPTVWKKGQKMDIHFLIKPD